MSPHTYNRQLGAARFQKSGNRYSNPYFRARAADRISSSRLKNVASRIPPRAWLWIVGSLIALGVIVWLIAFSNVFVISSVEVKGLPPEDSASVEQIIWEQADHSRAWFFSQSHLFIFKENDLADTIKSRYAVTSVRVVKKLPGTLIITVTEKSPTAVWFEADTYYLVDAEGSIIRRLAASREGLPVIYNNGQARADEKKLTGDISSLGIAADAEKGLREHFADFGFRQLAVDNDRATLKAVGKGGTMIYIATDQPLTSQLDRLDALLSTGDIKSRLGKLDYIDLRFGDRVYYK